MKSYNHQTHPPQILSAVTYAAGDVTTVPFKQIIIAMGDGAKVALTAFEDRLRKKAV